MLILEDLNKTNTWGGGGQSDPTTLISIQFIWAGLFEARFVLILGEILRETVEVNPGLALLVEVVMQESWSMSRRGGLEQYSVTGILPISSC